MIDEIKKHLRFYEDFPKPGIKFVDLMPLFESRLPDVADWLDTAIDSFAHIDSSNPAYLGGIESRGFILASAIVGSFGKNVYRFVPIRKPGKLPGSIKRISYDTEYSEDALEMQTSLVPVKRPIVLIDDLLATAGTLKAAAILADQAGYQVLGAAVVVDLVELHDELPFPVVSLIEL